jgi:hypothetical protein
MLAKMTKIYDTEKMLHIFKRNSQEGKYTISGENASRRFGELNTNIDQPIFAKDGESVVILSQNSLEEYTAVTNLRIISKWTDGEIIVSNENIKNVTIELNPLHNRKSEIDTLIIEYDGKTTKIKIESGPPLIGTWNVLKYIAAANTNS